MMKFLFVLAALAVGIFADSYVVYPDPWDCTFDVSFKSGDKVIRIQEIFVNETEAYLVRTIGPETFYLRSDLRENETHLIAVAYYTNGPCHEEYLPDYHLLYPYIPEFEFEESTPDLKCPGNQSNPCTQYCNSTGSCITLNANNMLVVDLDGNEYIFNENILMTDPDLSLFSFERCDPDRTLVPAPKVNPCFPYNVQTVNWDCTFDVTFNLGDETVRIQEMYKDPENAYLVKTIGDKVMYLRSDMTDDGGCVAVSRNATTKQCIGEEVIPCYHLIPPSFGLFNFSEMEENVQCPDGSYKCNKYCKYKRWCIVIDEEKKLVGDPAGSNYTFSDEEVDIHIFGLTMCDEEKTEVPCPKNTPCKPIYSVDVEPWDCTYDATFVRDGAPTHMQQIYVSHDETYMVRTIGDEIYYLRSDLRENDTHIIAVMYNATDGTCHEDILPDYHLDYPYYPKWEFEKETPVPYCPGNQSNPCTQYCTTSGECITLNANKMIVNVFGFDIVFNENILYVDPDLSIFSFNRCAEDNKTLIPAPKVNPCFPNHIPTVNWDCTFDVSFTLDGKKNRIQEMFKDPGNAYLVKTIEDQVMYLRSDVRENDTHCIAVTRNNTDDSCIGEEIIECMHLIPPSFGLFNYSTKKEGIACPDGSKKCTEYCKYKRWCIGLDENKMLVQDPTHAQFTFETKEPDLSVFGFRRCDEGQSKVPAPKSNPCNNGGSGRSEDPSAASTTSVCALVVVALLAILLL